LFINERNGSLSRGNSNKKNILEYLSKYYPLNSINTQFDIKTQNELLGWREYFYGDQLSARNNWKRNISLFLNFRLIIAFFITFLPNSLFNKFREMQIRLRLLHIVFFFSKKNKLITTEYLNTKRKILNYKNNF